MSNQIGTTIAAKYRSWPKVILREQMVKWSLPMFGLNIMGLIMFWIGWDTIGLALVAPFLAWMLLNMALIVFDNWRSPRLWLWVGIAILAAFACASIGQPEVALTPR